VPRPSFRVVPPSLTLFAGALFLRLAHLATVRDSPLFQNLFIDPAMYDEWGRRIASGSLLFDGPFFIDPLYSYFVGAIYAVTGPKPLAVALVQATLDAMVPVILYRASRRWLGAAAAWTAGAIACVHAMSIFWCGVLMKPSLSAFLAATSLGLLSRALASPSSPHGSSRP
jgi:hypothetical protein